VTIHLFGTDGGGASVHNHTVTATVNAVVGSYSFTVKPGSYTVCESIPAGYEQTFPVAGTGIVSCAGHSGAGGLGYSITLTSGQVDDDNHFGNARGSLLIEKRAKSASSAGCSEAAPKNCPVFGGATFKVTFTVGGALTFATVRDNVDAADQDPRAGYVCLDGVLLNTSFTIEETLTNNANYAPDPDKPTFSQGNSGNCASRAAAADGDVAFFNTPLSVIRVTFGSLADGGLGNDGATKSTIQCNPLVKDSTQVPPGDDVGDLTPAAFDDIEEIFTGLAPGTYNCEIVIDP